MADEAIIARDVCSRTVSRCPPARLPRLDRRQRRGDPLGEVPRDRRHRRGTPHHLVLTEDLIAGVDGAPGYDARYKVNPRCAPARTSTRCVPPPRRRHDRHRRDRPRPAHRRGEVLRVAGRCERHGRARVGVERRARRGRRLRAARLGGRRPGAVRGAGPHRAGRGPRTRDRRGRPGRAGRSTTPAGSASSRSTDLTVVAETRRTSACGCPPGRRHLHHGYPTLLDGRLVDTDTVAAAASAAKAATHDAVTRCAGWSGGSGPVLVAALFVAMARTGGRGPGDRRVTVPPVPVPTGLGPAAGSWDGFTVATTAADEPLVERITAGGLGLPRPRRVTVHDTGVVLHHAGAATAGSQRPTSSWRRPRIGGHRPGGRTGGLVVCDGRRPAPQVRRTSTPTSGSRRATQQHSPPCRDDDDARTPAHRGRRAN